MTALDLEQLDEMLFKASGMKSRTDYDQTIHPEKPLGVFIRELVGLDRHAAKEAFAEFLDDGGGAKADLRKMTGRAEWRRYVTRRSCLCQDS